MTSAAKSARMSAVDAAMSIAQDVAEGRVAPADLEAQALAECRKLFGRVAGPGDVLWELHVEVARQVLAVGGEWISGDELTEWAAVYRAAEEPAPVVVDATPRGPSWIEQALAEGADDDEEGDGDDLKPV